VRVSHLLHVFPNFVPNGMELRTIQVIGSFGREYRHSIVSMDGRTEAAARLPPGLDVRLVANPPRAGSLATARWLRKLLLAERPDLVLTYNWGAFDMLLAARSAGFARILHHEEGFNEDEAASFKRRRILARRLVLPGVHRVIVPSRRLLSIATDLWKLPAGRVRLIPNGVRLDGFAAADGHPELRRRLGIPLDAFVVGTVGSLRAVKNHLRLLEAAAAMPRAHVLLVGEGDQRPALEARAARPDLAGRVHLAGYQADPAPFYRAMDVFALTSDSEQMPVCLLEAMTAALPAVATDVGDVRAVLPPDQGDLVAPLDGQAAEALARGLSRLAGDPGARRRLGAANRKRVEESFTFEGMCEAYREVYHSALAA